MLELKPSGLETIIMVRIYDAAFAADRGDEHWHLATFWWIDATGAKGKWTRLEAHDYVAAHPRVVYVAEDGNRVLVGAHHDLKTGTKWIQTYADGVWRDNLTTLAIRHRKGLPNT
jgi:hypothetical protein